MSLSLQLPPIQTPTPSIQNGYFGWTDTGFPLASYLKYAPPPVSNVCELKPTTTTTTTTMTSVLTTSAGSSSSSSSSSTTPLTTITPFKTDGSSPNTPSSSTTASSSSSPPTSVHESLLERYHSLTAQENQLLQNLRDTTDQTTRRYLSQQLNSVLQKKLQELVAIGNSVEEKVSNLISNVDESVVLQIEEQPLGNVVANKYLEPPLVLSVSDKMMTIAREGRLQVRASLCLTLTDEPIDRTLDNKQEILQGNLVALVGIDGKACFNKLKIMEVSSKHRHQSFSIQLQLEEMKKSYINCDDKITVVGNPIKSSPLHVQSRINKRRRTNGSAASGGSYSAAVTNNRKRARSDFDSSYVDITSLLVLPQKEAATRLGISESMLCKRFKECTRRKWPYRYLRKIDKMLNVLSLSKKGEPYTAEDLEKIDKLKLERAECLNPVKIRITGHDMDLSTSLGRTGSPSDDSADSYEDSPARVKMEYSPSESESEDEIAAVVSTLNLMRRSTG